MSLSPEFKEELRSRIRLSDIIRRKVKLTKKSGDNYIGLCPFHKEKSPSFNVHDDKGYYHCFGCKVTGDVIRFVMETEGLSFIDTMASLAAQAGMELPKLSKKDSEAQKTTASLYEVLKLAAEWYQRQLFTRAGKEALSYLQQRGLNETTIDRFGLGFAPDTKGSLTTALKEQNISETLLLEAGLLGKGERGETYERFRNRIIFPILDTRNRVIAFGGRIMGSGQPKYLNSPETAVFKKSEVLYAENIAQKAANKSGNIILVEGYMDVIALHQAGIEYAVAPLGTAVTDLHLLRLWRLASEPVICMDGDEAGKKAMARVAEHSLPLLKAGQSLSFITLPKGQDPDELIKAKGQEAMNRLIAMAIPLATMLWNIEYNKKPLQTPDDFAALDMRLVESCKLITDPTIRNYYQKFFRQKLWEQGRFQYKKPDKKTPSPSVVMPMTELSALPQQDPIDQAQHLLLSIILHYPELLGDGAVIEELNHIDFISKELGNLRADLLNYYHIESHNGVISQKELQLALEKMGYTSNIKELCGSSSPYAYSCSHKRYHNHAKSLWYYFLNQYNLTLLRQEQQTTDQWTDKMRSDAYQIQIETLEKKIETLHNLMHQDDDSL